MHPLPNAVMTVIMGILVLYWLITLISGAGMDSFDVDVPGTDAFDVDTDIDIDATDVDGDISVNKEPGFSTQFLEFLNIGKVPFMLIITTLNFFMWIGSLITTSLLDAAPWGLGSLLILIPICIVSLIFTKFATNPMAGFFEKIGYKGEKEIDFFGCAGKMLSNIKGDKVGTAEFVIDKNPIKLNVRSFDGEELKYGDYIIIIEESEDKRIYYVSK